MLDLGNRTVTLLIFYFGVWFLSYPHTLTVLQAAHYPLRVLTSHQPFRINNYIIVNKKYEIWSSNGMLKAFPYFRGLYEFLMK